MDSLGFDRRFWIALAGICTILFAAMAGRTLLAQDDADDEPVFRRGLVARYVSDKGHEAVRVDRALSFNWQDRSPDRRLSTGKFSARWQGLLETEGEGRYELSVFAAGKVKIDLDGKTILDAEADKPQWLTCRPRELPYGYYLLDIQFEKTSDAARFGLYWSGPKFQLEPVGERQLVHRREHAPDERFERGEQLVKALRCGGCHTVPGEPLPTPAPELARLKGNVSHNWLLDWLTAKHGSETTVRRMPDFGLSRDEAVAVAAHLMTNSKVATSDSETIGKREAGETLFLTTGCLACHTVGELGQSGLFGGGDLSRIAEKRPASFFARWLAEPAKLNQQHRMPVFELSAKERADLAAYLSELREGPPAKQENPEMFDAKLVERGAALVEKRRCLACHAPDKETATKIVKTPLVDQSKWNDSCLGAPDSKKDRPSYRLADQDAAAVRTFVRAMAKVEKPDGISDGRYVLAERNCVACHARDASLGLAAKLPAVAEAHESLTKLLPAMTPPPLASVGDKLHAVALAEAIERKGPVHRPWLRVRMPKYELTTAERDALLTHLTDADRIPDRPVADRPSLPSDGALAAAGGRLVTTDGFGCTSCHKVGMVLPEKAPLNALGPDLSLVGRRVREPWFERWVRSPARIVPRMEMPSVQIPVRGVLAERLDHQLAAVWHVLNQSGFEPPRPGPIRTLRRGGLEKQNERALVLTDVLKQDKQVWIKPQLVGLPNRHNTLFDLETNRLAAWWIGDTARQRTEGKTWFWEPASADLLQSGIVGSEVLLVNGGKPQEPLVVGQFLTEADAWQHTDGGIEFSRRLRFAATKGEPYIVTVKERWTAFWFLENLTASGWSRDVSFESLPPEASIHFRLVAKERIDADLRDDGGWSLELKGPAEARIEIDMEHDGQPDRSGVVVLKPEGEETSLDLRLDYISKLPVDRFEVPDEKHVAGVPEKLGVVPGYEAQRLPLSNEIMPTALAWRPDGTLVIASLKGQVFHAKDTNRDGFEDSLTAISDELATPYGLIAEEKHIDVVTKSALLRLYDDNADGRTDRTETLASGWGHTADYHDWAVGMERDAEGNRYIAIPCQQDKRSAAAARLRGTVLKLTPREPTGVDPHRYALEELSAGHRFPMGLARNRSGEMFVTDNQGNYNPFNELNHVVRGKRYGFINALEKGDDFPEPPQSAAVEIPHPWTRSVNGICFLETPKALRKEAADEGKKHFGPFEGHLVGCEYDTRRLIRMSLERVGGQFQGACYPFTHEGTRPDDSLLGPLVCAISPLGDLVVGCIRDSGWGGANNVGAVTRLRPLPELPAGIAEVRLAPAGFTIDFTHPVSAKLAADPASYAISSYRRVSTPAYGGPDVDRRTEKLDKVSLSQDRRRTTIELAELREGFVYELRLKNLAGGQNMFHPAEAYYTLRKKVK